MKTKNNKDLQNMTDEELDTPVVTESIVFNKYTIEISDGLVHPKQFSTVVKLLHNANPQDMFEFHLMSCMGGCVETAERLAYAIDKTQATVHFIVTGSNDSAAARLILSAHSVEMSEDVTSLIHAGSMSNSGEFKEYRDHGKFVSEHHEATIRRWYKDFLSEEEIVKVLHGSGVSLDRDGWLTRLLARRDSMLEDIELEEELLPFQGKTGSKLH